METLKIAFVRLALLFVIAATTVSCSKDDNAPDSGGGAESGYLTGRVTDASGKPLAVVKIVMDNALLSGAVTGKTDNDGTYKIKIPYGAWTASAYVTSQYHQQDYSLRERSWAPKK